jgi:hypothetical protein
MGVATSFALVGPPWAVNAGAVGKSEAENPLDISERRWPLRARPRRQVSVQRGVFPALRSPNRQRPRISGVPKTGQERIDEDDLLLEPATLPRSAPVISELEPARIWRMANARNVGNNVCRTAITNCA